MTPTTARRLGLLAVNITIMAIILESGIRQAVQSGYSAGREIASISLPVLLALVLSYAALLFKEEKRTAGYLEVASAIILITLAIGWIFLWYQNFNALGRL